MAEKEYIERGALLQRISLQANRTSLGEISEPYMTWKDVLVEIKCSPAADVAPVVHARWKDNHCTACGMMPMGEELWDSCDFAPPKFEYFMDFCPHCGACMDGGKHG